MGIEALREGILNKARGRAKEIIERAESEAKEIISKSLRIYEERVKQERERAYRELSEEYRRKLVDESLRLNLELLRIKNEVVSDLVSNVVTAIRNLNPERRKESLRRLLKESLPMELLKNGGKVVVHVVKNDEDIIKELIREERLDNIVAGINVIDDKYLGGVLIESGDGEVLIDNTYLTRIERALSIIIRRLNEEVFKEV